MKEWTIDEVVAALLALGVTQGSVLLVHTSYRKVRPVEGGPVGLLRALRLAVGTEGTLAMPTMTDGESPFDPRATPTCEMGIVAETFWRRPGVVRSDHPGGSFAAEGPLAESICRPQPLSPPHGPKSPVGRVYDHDGYVLLLGVGHSENTSLHLAEAGAQVPYSVSHPCVVVRDGVPRTELIAETDHCCEGFRKMDDWLRAAGLQREGKIGNADARLVRSRDIVATAVEKLRDSPLVFLCAPRSGCGECHAAHASVTCR